MESALALQTAENRKLIHRIVSLILSASQALIWDWRAKPFRPATRSMLAISHRGKSRLMRRSISASLAGVAKISSLSKPRVSGAAFRYGTEPMRNLVVFSKVAEFTPIPRRKPARKRPQAPDRGRLGLRSASAQPQPEGQRVAQHAGFIGGGELDHLGQRPQPLGGGGGRFQGVLGPRPNFRIQIAGPIAR